VFLPLYAVALALAGPGSIGVIYALIGADVVVGLWAWWRVARLLNWRRGGLAPAPHGFWNRPDPRLARTIASYGIRGQVGGLLTLLNTRLDFAILAAMSGPAVLGSYAVASKYAELLRLPSLALTWIAYPRLAKLDHVTATGRAVAMARPALAVVALAAVPVFLLTAPVTTMLYGDGFDSAVLPAHVLIAGMVLSGGAGAASGYLYGCGRPGLNSTVLALGLGITVVLDLLLIPPYAAVGAAVASAIAYLVSDGVLLLVLARMSRKLRRPGDAQAGHSVLESTARVSP
jgi:O-antigen/teichoic acid export membrane protein